MLSLIIMRVMTDEERLAGSDCNNGQNHDNDFHNDLRMIPAIPHGY